MTFLRRSKLCVQLLASPASVPVVAEQTARHPSSNLFGPVPPVTRCHHLLGCPLVRTARRHGQRASGATLLELPPASRVGRRAHA